MNPLKAYEASISYNDYRFTSTLGDEQLEDAIFKLLTRVLKLTDQEMAFFCMPDFLQSARELETGDSTAYQVSKSRIFTLNIKRIV